MPNPTLAPPPWYRQFWPWFLIALPGSAVIASFASLSIALNNADSLVRPDWYEHGYRINTDIAKQQTAAHLGIAASLILDESGRELQVVVSGPPLPADSLQLHLHHPTHAVRDVTLQLVATGANHFSAITPQRIDGTWDAALTPADADWALRRRVWLTSLKPAELTAAARTTP